VKKEKKHEYILNNLNRNKSSSSLFWHALITGCNGHTWQDAELWHRKWNNTKLKRNARNVSYKCHKIMLSFFLTHAIS